MRTALIAILAACLAAPAIAESAAKPAAAAVTPEAVESRIAEVVVHPGWATVTRVAKLTTVVGMSTVRLLSLPSWIDLGAVQAELGGDGTRVVSVAAELVKRSGVSDTELAALEQQLTAKTDEEAGLERQLQVLKTEHEYLTKLVPWKLEPVPQESASRTVKGDEVAEIRKVTEAMQANVDKQAELTAKLRELAKSRSEVWDELADAKRQQDRLVTDIRVVLATTQAGSTELRVSYVIAGAAWLPAYDLQVTDAVDRVALQMRALVRQQTEEDWRGVKLRVSSRPPHLFATPLAHQPWQLKPTGPALSATAAAATVRHATHFEKNAERAAAYADLCQAVSRSRLAVTPARGLGVFVELAAKGPETIVADAAETAIPLVSAELPVTRRYLAAPATEPEVQAIGTVSYASGPAWLPGPLEVLRDGRWIGRTQLPFTPPGGDFEVFLGAAAGVTVSRDLHLASSHLVSAAGRRRLVVAYELGLTSTLKGPIEIEARDRLPQSAEAAVKVELLDTQPLAVVGEQGQLSWQIQLAPGKAQTVRYEFNVEYPETAMLPDLLELERLVARRLL